MWLKTCWKLRRLIRRYRSDKKLETVLRADWRTQPELQAFFADLEERLHGEEITRLQQKQAEYLALQNQINPHFCIMRLKPFERTHCWQIRRRLLKRLRHWQLFSLYDLQCTGICDLFR